MTFTLSDIQNSREYASTKAKPSRYKGNQGIGLEKIILASMDRGVIALTKVPTASRRIRTPHGPQIVQTRSPVDFFGCLIPSGRLIVFDAKEAENPNRLKTSPDHFPQHQRLEILRYGEAGAIAGLFCHCSADTNLYWCDWRLLLKERPSIAWDEMALVGSSRFAVKWENVVNASGGVQ